MFRWGICAVLISQLAATALASTEDQNIKPQPVQWPLLTSRNNGLTFQDDFSREQRDRYTVQGDVVWTNGRVRLSEKAVMERFATIGPVAELDVQLLVPKAVGQTVSESRFGFLLRDKSAMVAIIWQRSDGKQHGEVRILANRRDKDGKQTHRVVRRFPLTAAPGGLWTVRYNHGVMFVDHNGARIGAAELNFVGASLQAIVLSQPAGQVECQHLHLTAWPVPNPPSDKERASRKKLWPDFDRAIAESSRLQGPKTARLCLEATERAVALSRQLLGEDAGITLSLLSRIASCHQVLQQYQQALKVHKQALQSARNKFGDNHPDTAQRREDLASCYGLMGLNEQALAEHEQALAVFRAVHGESSDETAHTYLATATVLAALNRFARAADYYQHAVVAYEGIDGRERMSVAFALEQTGTFFWQTCDYGQAQEYLKQAIVLRTKLQGPNSRKTLGAMRCLAKVQRLAGNYVAARETLEQVVARSEKTYGLKDSDTGEAMAEMASVLAQIGDSQMARQRYESAVETLVASRGENDDRTASVLAGFGGFLFDQHEVAAAERFYERAWKSQSSSRPDHALTLNILRDLALVKEARGDFETARSYLETVLGAQIKAHGEQHGNTAVTLMSLGDMVSRQRNWPEALRYYQRALAANSKVYGEDGFVTALTWRNLGNIYQHLKREDDAMRAFEKSLATIKRLLGENHPQTVESHKMLAGAMLLAGDWRGGQQHLQEALAADTTFGFEVMQALPETQAVRYVTRIVDTRDWLMRVLLLTKRFGKKQPKLRTVPNASDADVYQWIWRTKALATRAVTGQRRADENDPEILRLRRELNTVREQLAQWMLTVPAPGKKDAYALRLVRLTQEKEKRQFQLARRSNSYRTSREIDQATLQDLVQKLPDDVAVIDFVRISAGAKGELIDDPDEPTAYYEAFVFWKDESPRGFFLKWVDLGATKPVDTAADQWRRAAGSRGLDLEPDQREVRWKSAGSVLRKLIWDRIVPHLGGRRTLIVIPDGLLARIPWGALPGSRPGTFLVEDYRIAMAAYGSQVLDLLQRPKPRGDRLVLVGGVAYETNPDTPAKVSPTAQKRWKPLPGTQKEAEAIEQLWQSHGAVSFLHDRLATEKSLKSIMPSSRFVHLATHGRFARPQIRSTFQVAAVASQQQSGRPSPAVARERASLGRSRNPLTLSSIVLAGANAAPQTENAGKPMEEDGLLTAEEVAGMDLRNTQLVVLSACDTGLGHVAGGEGVFGFQRALHAGGVRSVVASLWKVDDDATRVLMTEFYKNFWNKKMGALAALQAAQVNMIHRYDPVTRRLADPRKPQGNRAELRQLPPFYWAAFVLSGDWRGQDEIGQLQVPATTNHK